MSSISSTQFRQLRADFRKSKNHTQIPPAPLVAPKSTKALFNVAGMQQLTPYFSGQKHELGSRLFNIQPCVRTNDIDEVGDDTHLTMFEMAGNRSLGDYFKKDSLTRSREFLTEKLRLDPAKIAVTVFEWDEDAPRDSESAKIRESLGVKNISFLGKDDNRRSPGPVWPCGPDSEIFYRIGDRHGGPKFPPADSTPGSDEANRMEIRNNVFMEFYRDESGKLSRLPAQNVDTGMGFERICSLLQGVQSPFATDIFAEAMEILKSLPTRSARIVADHTRTALAIIAEWIRPSNESRGYIVRMLIRRLREHLTRTTAEPDAHQILEKLANFRNATPDSHEIFFQEISQFQKTLARGRDELQKLFKNSTKKEISWPDAFKLYDSFGFPLALTRSLATEQGRTVDEAGFETALAAQQSRSKKSAHKLRDASTDWTPFLTELPPTEFVGHTTTDFSDATLLKDFTHAEQRVLIFDRTPFYAEGGGQTSDSGTITLDSGETLRISSVKNINGIFLHFADQN